MSVLVAAATPWGRSAIALVRLTGPGLDAVLGRLIRGYRSEWPARRARTVVLVDGEGPFDDAVLTVFRGPRSYTGEDLAELGCHGNPLLVERLLAACVAAGAEPAGPGAFTRRAVENGKLDLVQAEAVQQVVDAATPAGVRIARLALEGRLSKTLAWARAGLVDGCAQLEAELDHPEEVEPDEAVWQALDEVADRAAALAASHDRGRLLVHGARVALVGEVNAGKSSLFNALIGSERALVHDRAGTTRDVLEVAVQLGPLAVTLLDTAGERQTDDPVEAAGLALAARLVARVDLVVVVVRGRPEGPSEVARTILARTEGRPRVVVTNGLDRPGVVALPGSVGTVATSGEGLEALGGAVQAALLETSVHAEQEVIASVRQRDLLDRTARAIREAREGYAIAGPAVASELLLEAIAALDELTGADSREEVLDALFSRFCIGK